MLVTSTMGEGGTKRLVTNVNFDDFNIGGNPPGSAVNANFPTSICSGGYVSQKMSQLMENDLTKQINFSNLCNIHDLHISQDR